MQIRPAAAMVLVALSIGALWAPGLQADPVAVRFVEGVTRGFPVLRSLAGERLAHGELIQIPRGDVVESRLVFRFNDGSVHDETVVFSQRGVFTLERYRLLQQGPSFPESVEATIDRTTRQYHVRYRADEDSPEEIVSGLFELPADVYSGMLGLLLKNLPDRRGQTVQIVVFTPKPRLVKILIAPAAEETLAIADRPFPATRYLIKPQLGLLASLLVIDLVPPELWIVSGDVPAFVRFQGPLFFMGPVWRIELN